jgi:multidrug efflux system outer membrane protein
MRLSKALVIVCGAFLAGCSLEPRYERPPAPVPGEYPSEGLYAGTHSDASGAANPGWREVLRDARLQRLVELALRSNRDLRVAALNVAQVQAQYRIQRAAVLPAVAGVVDASRGGGARPSDSASSFTTGLEASWEIDFFGRLRSLSRAALEQYFASGYARRAAQITLIAQVADQYFTILALEDQLAVTQRTLSAAEESMRIVKLQFDTGTGTELSLRQAETVVEQARANAAAQERSRAQAQNALDLLVGEPPPADLPAPAPLAQQAVADIPAGLPSQLLERRPDILEAEAVLRAENASIGAARAAFFPRISLTAFAGVASTSLSGLFNHASRTWSFAPSIAVPIFQGGALRASLDVARIQKDIGIAQYERAIQSAFREVSDGLAARGTFDAQLAALERNAAAQRRRLALSEFRFRNGVDAYLSVLTAQTDLYSSEQALVAARLQRLTSLVDLYRALGGGWSGEQADPGARPAP